MPCPYVPVSAPGDRARPGVSQRLPITGAIKGPQGQPAAAGRGRGRRRWRAGHPGAAAMPRALLFLPLFLLILGGSVLPAALPGPGAGDPAAARALLAELAEHVPPRALPEGNFSCQDLRPDALPGFPRLPLPLRALARAAMALALSGAACGPQAEAEVLGLSQELGPTMAAALLRGLARLRGTPAPQALSVLLSLVQPGVSAPPRLCGVPTRLQRPTASTHPTPAAASAEGVRVPPGTSALAWLLPAATSPGAGGEDEDACDPPGEREAHEVLEWVPGVSTFYNLGTSLYYAFQGCEVVASTRALEVAEDLGYAGLAAITAGASSPVALGLQLGLQPGLKAGVRALIGYFTADEDAPPAPTAHSGPVLIV
ncbi:LOW QUALITY PROTEIN: apolipoprotein F [Falco peregrinus]|uniref:LOW QUALITY PROTEIN: apolipoprotein F n=1 Tax=Falco peregrinus TaxID=8954 RepID=UPI00247B2743|nr:LOW QUALITY PROTEIN: apolipoprotein F [Falco peregrinus]